MSLLNSIRNSAQSKTFALATDNQKAQSVFSKMQEPKPAVDRTKPRVFLPFRFKLKTSSTANVVVLDDDFTYAHEEHAMPNPDGSFNKLFEICIADQGHVCPLCRTGNKPYGAAFLTVLDLTPFTSKKGVEYQFSKKLMVIKSGDLEIYKRLKDQQGSLRGVVLTLSRGDNKLSSVNGTPLYMRTLTESEIIENFGSEERRNDEGRVMKAENADCYALDYESAFSPKSALDLEYEYRISPTPGSRREAAASAPTPVARSNVTSALATSLTSTTSTDPLDGLDEIPFN